MIALPWKKKHAPIGLDFGSSSVKLIQFNHDGTQLIDAARWDMTSTTGEAEDNQQHLSALSRAREGRKFRGRDVVICLGRDDLFLQNVRVPKASGEQLQTYVHQEAAGRLPFSVTEAEIRFLEAADVRQGEQVMREVILLACHRPRLMKQLKMIETAGLNPVAVDVEPMAMLRCYVRQYRRDADHHQRTMLLRIGHRSSIMMIAEGERVLFLKYLDLGGHDFDLAVADHLQMEFADAVALRRHHGDRRSDQRDAEISAGIAAAIRPVVERLVSELSMAVRYHSVTFRGQPLARLVVGGGEACSTLVDLLGNRLDLRCELGEPLRNYDAGTWKYRQGQWDVATGLALRELVAE